MTSESNSSTLEDKADTFRTVKITAGISIVSFLIGSVFMLGIGIILYSVFGILCSLAISGDKKARKNAGYNAVTHHTITVLAFSIFSFFIYNIFYLIARSIKSYTEDEHSEEVSDLDPVQSNLPIENGNGDVETGIDAHNDVNQDDQTTTAIEESTGAELSSEKEDYPDAIYCTECGTKLASSAQFCTECGSELSSI